MLTTLRLRYLLIGIAVLIAVGLLLNFGVKQKIKTLLADNASQLGTVDYSDLEVNILTGKICLHDLELVTRLSRIIPTTEDAKLQISTTLAQLDGLHWWDIWRNNQLIVSELRFEKPFVQFHKGMVADTTLNKEVPEKEQQKFGAAVEKITILEGAFQMFDSMDDSLSSFRVDTLLLDVEGLEFDSENDSIPWKIKSHHLDIRQLVFLPTDRLHQLTIPKIKLDNGALALEDLSYRSRFTKKTFSKKLKWKKARLNVAIPKLVLVGLDLNKLLLQQKIYGRQLRVTKPILKAYIDRNVPHNTQQYKPLPQQILRDLETNIRLDSVVVKNGFLELELLSPNREATGKLNWQKVNLSLQNLTNDSIQLTKNGLMTARSTSQFMGTSNLQTYFTFDLTSPINAYTFAGDLAEFSMPTANRLLEDALLVRINEGTITELSFEATANENSSIGTLNLDYKNLNLDILKEDYGKKRNVLTWLVEKTLIRKENPNRFSKKQGNIKAERDKSKDVFNQMWLSLLSGMKDTLLPF